MKNHKHIIEIKANNSRKMQDSFISLINDTHKKMLLKTPNLRATLQGHNSANCWSRRKTKPVPRSAQSTLHPKCQLSSQSILHPKCQLSSQSTLHPKYQLKLLKTQMLAFDQRRIPEEFPKNSRRIPEEFPKNSRRIPEEFPWNSRGIPVEFPTNSRFTENSRFAQF